MKKLFVIEPRENGKLNTKSEHWNNNRLTSIWNNATENQIFDYYFQSSKENEPIGWDEVNKWYNNQGLFIRAKTW